MNRAAPSHEYLAHVQRLNASYRAGEIHVHLPQGLCPAGPDYYETFAHCLPASHAAREAAVKGGLFDALEVAFDPEHSVGPYLATIDRDSEGRPYRFLDMGAQIASRSFGENDPDIAAAVLEHLPYAVNRYAHSHYQTEISLRLKAALGRIAPRGTPRFFVVNTGSETVENAMKAALIRRVKAESTWSGFVVSFEGAFHGRTLGSLAVTHRRKARLGFPTFDWPHVPFPFQDASEKQTLKREQRSLFQTWSIIVSGTPAGARSQREQFALEMSAIDGFLAAPGDLEAFLQARRGTLSPEAWQRSRKTAAVLVEPIQGEGGVRVASGRFFRQLRLLTLIYAVPLIFDEVQTGWGATGTMWAHDAFDLPAPPDAVCWAKKAQNGVLFVSEGLAAFFQEEKKFNTTWEGESLGMVRLLVMLDKLDLERVRSTGRQARAGLEAIASEYPELVRDVRGAGVMLAFDVARPDWRDALLEECFLRGLILLPAGERVLRFYPRYDTEPYAIEEALDILRRALDAIVVEESHDRRVLPAAPAPPLEETSPEALEALDLTPAGFVALRNRIMSVEIEAYGLVSNYPPQVLEEGRRPLLQYDAETLEATLGHANAIGVALRQGRATASGPVVGFALGSPLELHDEVGARSDGRMGENDTFFLQALATLPRLKNRRDVEARLLDLVRERALARGYTHLSTLIEESTYRGGPEWFRSGEVLLTADDYLGSGIRFVYVQARLSPGAAIAQEVA